MPQRTRRAPPHPPSPSPSARPSSKEPVPGVFAVSLRAWRSPWRRCVVATNAAYFFCVPLAPTSTASFGNGLRGAGASHGRAAARAMPDGATSAQGVVDVAAAETKTARQALLLVSQTDGENAAAVRAKGEELANARLSARLLAELHIQTKSADSLLLFAAAHDLVDVARLALDRGANMDATDGKAREDDEDYEDSDDSDDPYNHDDNGKVVGAKNTALIIAARNGSIECLRLLLENGAFKFLPNRAGDIPLSAAAQMGEVDCLRALIEAHGNTLHDAEHEISRAGGRPLLLLAAESGSAECVRLLLGASASLYRRDGCGLFALLGAVKKGHVDCVRQLLDAMKAVTTRTFSIFIQTAALAAYKGGKTECLKLLIEAGADPEQLK